MTYDYAIYYMIWNGSRFSLNIVMLPSDILMQVNVQSFSATNDEVNL